MDKKINCCLVVRNRGLFVGEL